MKVAKKQGHKVGKCLSQAKNKKQTGMLKVTASEANFWKLHIDAMDLEHASDQKTGKRFYFFSGTFLPLTKYECHS